ncbi:carbohydrate ABC transporter permease [Jiangella asiatica]|uniref:carbohydrate ABC transporter permease n=1 Tax=Jiangella asiatica TaxID=2530372 RepID=UPI00193DBB8F|nr:carbohydrate ABC transporter permease [Jiangella asiatica]
MYVGLAAASVLALTPILWAVSTSLKPESLVINADPTWIPTNLTFENYRIVLNESMFPRYVLNTFLVAVAAVLFTLVCALPAAYAASRLPFRGQRAMLFCILTTTMIPGIAILVPTYYLAVTTGLYDTFVILVIVYAAWQVPSSVWVLRGFVDSVPVDIEEAARIDGCSRIGAFLRVLMPILRPGIGGAFILAFVNIWNDFLIASTMVSTDERRLVSVGLYQYLSDTGVIWGQLTAAVVVTLLPIIVLFTVLSRYLTAGLAAGATKG